jgi:hypothetical protein
VRNGKILFVHTQSGWANEEVCNAYLEWLRRLFPKNIIGLLWDCFSAHKRDSVKAKAGTLGIELKYVPAGQTGEWQPLDHRIFGVLKSKGKSAWAEEQVKAIGISPEEKEELNMIWAIRSLVRCWDGISTETIKGAWSMFH